MDFYVLLRADDGGRAPHFKIMLIPDNWVWIGGIVMILGTIIATWTTTTRTEATYVLKPQAVTSQVG
jgi:cytochrome c biogenesis factor